MMGSLLIPLRSRADAKSEQEVHEATAFEEAAKLDLEFPGKGVHFEDGSLRQRRAAQPAGLVGDDERPETAVVSSRIGRLTFAGDARGFVLRRLLALSDLVALSLAAAVAVAVSSSLGRPPVASETIVAFVVCLPAWLLIANAIGLYHIPDRRLGPSAADEIGPTVFALALWSWCLLLVEAVIAPGAPELLLSAVIWVAGLAVVLGLRALTRALSRRRPWYEQRVAILGTPIDVRRVARRLKRHPELGLKVACVGEIAENEAVGNGSVPAVIDIVARAKINRVIVASLPGQVEERSALIRILSELHVHVDVVSGDSDAIPAHATLHYMEGLPLLTIAAVRAPRSRAIFKRVFDAAAAGSGLIVLSPLLAYCAIRIRLESPGPALFRQIRIGKDGKPFEVLKFRTMVDNAELQKQDLVALSLYARGMFKVADDPRTTKFGAWLRRWSIDELPQLWNVVRGQMSLVGPRPLSRRRRSWSGVTTAPGSACGLGSPAHGRLWAVATSASRT